MSAIHTGSIAVRIVNGRAHFFGESRDHAVTGWPEPGTNPPVFIPKQRSGNAYEQVVLKPADDLADLSDLVQIPSMRPFAFEYIRDHQDENETGVQP